MSSVPYPNAQAIFFEQYERVRRDEMVGILLALFLGGFGIHHFYLRRTGLGILYLCFFWTPLPWVLGFIECFFMPGRVREFNAIQAAGIAAALGMSVPMGWGWPVHITVQAAVPVSIPPAANSPAGNPAAGSSAAAVSGFLPLQGPLITCSACGRTNAAGARFCSGCGAAL